MSYFISIVLRSLYFLIIATNISFGQVTTDWCLSKCNIEGDEPGNAVRIHEKLSRLQAIFPIDSVTIERLQIDSNSLDVCYPLRIGIVALPFERFVMDESRIYNTIEILNNAFSRSSIRFQVARIDTIYAPLRIEDLSLNTYQPYLDFSTKYDLQDTVSLFIFKNQSDLCHHTAISVSCGRKGGFSYVLSQATNNVVISRHDLEDHKVVVHEFGHFFGLYHTFEVDLFGKERIERIDCDILGDRICDTPADPGPAYSIFINYSLCEMNGLIDSISGLPYKPMINNYMSYYGACYMKEYAFTPEQNMLLIISSRDSLRRHFIAN
jgi:hypothetical protein